MGEMLLNWLIGGLIVLILAFVASLAWKQFFSSGETTFSTAPPEQTTTVPAQKIRIEVLNGCGEAGLASRFTDYLRSQGFDVVLTDNYQSFDVDSSFVIDRASMDAENGLRVASSLGIVTAKVRPIISDELAVEATLVLGRDYESLNGYSRPQP